MRQDALQVFYGQNRFVVAPTGGVTWTGVDHPPERLPISSFLSSVVTMDALHYLRFLEIVFPPFGIEQRCIYCPAQSTQWQDWIETLEKAKEHLDLPKLTIRVCFAEYLPPQPPWMSTIPPYRARMANEERNAILEMYTEILSPLKNLRGLARFFAHLSDPTAWAEERMEPQDLEKLEQDIERCVMGEDYDAVSAGKFDFIRSRWLDDEEGHSLYGASIE
jgi:hypothetical protein